MARRRITDQSEQENEDVREAIDVEHDDVSALHDEQLEEENDILGHFGAVPDGVRMHFQVHKVRQNSKITDFCFEGTRDDFPVTERIQRDFGTGTYKIMIFKNGKLFRAPSMGVIAPKTPLLPPSPSADPNFSRLIDLLTDQAQNRREKREMNTAELLTAGAAVVTAVMPLIQMMRANGAGGSAKDTLELLSAAKDLFAGGEREPKSIMDVAAEVLPAMIQQAHGAPTPTPKLAPPNLTPEQQVQQMQLQQIRAGLHLMIGRARASAPPELYADVLDDLLPEQFAAMLKGPGAIDILLQMEPAIGTYRPWFEAVLRALREGDMEDDHSEGAHVSQRPGPGVQTGYDPQRFGGRAPHAQSHDGEDESGEIVA